jgi:hypothetical protein
MLEEFFQVNLKGIIYLNDKFRQVDIRPLFLIANEMHMEQGLTILTDPMLIGRYLPLNFLN